jgi:hypothetical protein
MHAVEFAANTLFEKLHLNEALAVDKIAALVVNTGAH